MGSAAAMQVADAGDIEVVVVERGDDEDGAGGDRGEDFGEVERHLVGREVVFRAR